MHGLPGFQRFYSLEVEEGGKICVATLVRAGLAALAVGALVWLLRMLAQRRGAAAQASAIDRTTVELPPDVQA